MATIAARMNRMAPSGIRRINEKALAMKESMDALRKEESR